MPPMNEQYFEKFTQILDTENKEKALEYVLELLNEKRLTLEELYLDLLAPSLTLFSCPVQSKEICIWKEHTRTSIVRTILECTFPYVAQRRKEIVKRTEKVMVLCPSEEYHEIGAIIVNNFFLLAGYESQYIGANTPKHDIIMAVKALQPDYVALSVTNYYNIVITKQITEAIKAQYPTVKIIVGGQAFLQQGALEQVTYDHYLKNVQEIDAIFKKDSL